MRRNGERRKIMEAGKAKCLGNKKGRGEKERQKVRRRKEEKKEKRRVKKRCRR